MSSSTELRYLTARQVTERLQICVATLYSMVAQGKFPEPRKFGRSSRWSMDEVVAWENSCPQGVDRGDTDSRLNKANKSENQAQTPESSKAKVTPLPMKRSPSQPKRSTSKAKVSGTRNR